MATWKQYLFATAIFLTILLLKIFAGVPTLILPLIVMICAWYLDLGPGTLVAVLFSCLLTYLMVHDRNYTAIDLTQSAIFAAINIGTLLMIWHIKRNTNSSSILSFNILNNCSVVSLDKQGKITKWNETAHKYFLYTDKEVLGSPWYKLFCGEDIRSGLPEKILAIARAEGAWIGEVWRVRKNGTRFWCSLIVVKNVEGYHCVARDITDQKHCMDSVEKWQNIFYKGGWAASVADGHTNLLTHVNPAFASMHGYDPEELIGKPMTMLLAPEFITEVPKHIRAANLADNDYIYESVHIRKDGQRFPAKSHVSVFRDNMGRPLYWVSITEDVTEQIRIRKNLHQLTDNLSAANEAKDEFNAVLAHELRNPLSPILITLHVYQQTGSIDADAIELINRNVTQIQRLVDDLMDVTRINKGKIVIQKSKLDLRDIMALAIEQTHSLMKAKNLKLFKSFPTESAQLDADPARLQQIFVNLLNNAAKYTDEGGYIWITVELQCDKVVVKIRDNGIGISPRMLPRIFDVYSQAGPALHRAQGGLGLGLALVRKLVHLHDGTVSASSPGEGQGSTFVVTLPVLATDPEMQISPRLCGGGFLDGKKILVVDDNTDAAMSMQMMLALDGCDVMVAYDGEEALRIYDIFQPEITLLDIGLPKLNGYEVAKQIRSRDGGYGTALIAVTGYGQPADILRSKEAGFDSHVVKPVEPNRFKQIVQSTFETRQKAGRDNHVGLL